MKQGILVGTIVFLISTPGGYFLNKFLLRDIITIENVELFAKKDNLNIDQTEFSNISTCLGGVLDYWPDDFYITREFFTLRNIVPRERMTVLTHYMNSGKIQLDIHLKKLEDLKKIDNWGAEDDWYNLSLPSLKLLLSDFSLCRDSDLNMEQLNILLEKDQNAAKECRKLIEKFIVNMSSQDVKKIVNFDIVITLLNAGDTDGLIRPNGRLGISGLKDTPLSIVLADRFQGTQSLYPLSFYQQSSTNRFGAVKVQRRSMDVATFSLDKLRSPQNAVKRLESLVTDNKTIDFDIELTDFRGNTVEAKNLQKLTNH